jgi:hypothetical protein
MKKILALMLTAVLSVMMLTACGGGGGKYADSPYVGKWNATTAEMSGIQLQVSDIMNEFSITLNDDGSCTVVVDTDGDKETGKGEWEPREGGGVTVKDDSGTLDFDDQDGKLTIVYEGVTMYFEKE